VALWLEFRGGMGGRGPLPFAGGLTDQPALVWAAFSVIADAWDKLNPQKSRSE
jgi:hypothetical protein